MFLSVFCCNIRSINEHFDEFVLFLNSDKFNCNLYIIVLTENWHKVEYCNFGIPGHRLFFSNVKKNQNNGIIVFVRSHLFVEYIKYKIQWQLF